MNAHANSQNVSNDRIIGEVKRVIFKNEDNGYQVLVVAIDSTTEVVVTINHVRIYEGVTMEFRGSWTENQKFGRQFKCEEAWEVPPSTTEGLISFLCSSFFNGIGPIKARRIVNKFGDETYDILDNNIHRLLEINGVSEGLVDKIKRSWDKNKEIKDIMIFLQSYQIPAALASKIYQEYEKNCVKQIQQDPYDLIYKIKGVGFKKADEIAKGVGFDLKSDLRIDACIVFILNQASKKGHTFLTLEQVVQDSTSLIGEQMQGEIGVRLDALRVKGKIFVYEHESETRYYGRKLWENENYVSDKIKVLNSIHRANHFHGDLFDKLAKDQIVLSEEQEGYIHSIVNNGVSILTGGPGTGKSFTVKSIIKVLEVGNKSVLLCAPTGRAAKRLSEATGREAKTIHRTLGWDHINFGFEHNEMNPLGCDFLVVDEASMVDINLCSDLLRAVPNSTQVLFVGDIDQLPPVGPGDPLRDMIRSNQIPTYTLTQIFRQEEGSDIIDYSHKINNGIIPEIESPISHPDLWQNKSECLFIDSGFASPSQNQKDFPRWNSLHYGKNVVDMILHIYSETIPKFYGADKDVQILIPMRKGPTGTVELNKRIQEKVNPSAQGKREVKVFDTFFRIGDKVIQTSNNYDLGVYNGDVGKIVDIGPSGSYLQVKFDYSDLKTYMRESMPDLELAYCISIHKSQGSEFDYIIIPLTMSYYRMLYRNLIYTGLTRAKRLAVFIGERKSLDIAIGNTNYEARQTSLKEFLVSSEKEIFLFE